MPLDQHELPDVLMRAVQAATNGIVITRSEGDLSIVYCNPAFEQLTGYASSEILGRNCRFLQGKDTDLDTRAHLRRAVNAGEAADVILLNYRKDGTPFWNALNLAPIRDAQGRLTHYVGIQTDVTQRIELQRSLEEQVYTDDLTGLRNRAHFMQALHAAVRGLETGALFAVGFADLDDFKAVNDAFGHEAGDELLREVGRRLRQCVRKGDVVARLAGDEFVVLIRTIEDHTLDTLAPRLLQALERPVHIQNVQVRVQASLGFILPAPGLSADEVLAAADQAMYDAKRAGKHTFVIRDARPRG
ncbi:diguanylate cyclase (plasmid) [Deinococcus taeanensis]|uniref:GGDEF domain-containing protein n=1 Tax=Deinococcus taeanensis TaxID=2737050 RepID=UPI001CDB5A74|nr:GGDEF domain-containing protein [Deinococcus taeanensis]UBV44708.1 diguanylate cyclase [Deinococcus taeanensis]